MVEPPLAKKARMEDEKENISSSPTNTSDGNVIVIDEEDLPKSTPTTPLSSRSPRTPGSKRRHDVNREEKELQKLEKQRQREEEKRQLEEKKLQEKREKDEERERQKQARELEKQRKDEEKRQKQAEKEAEAQARREQKQREEEAAKKAKEDERIRRKIEKEEEARRTKEEKQRLADEKKRQQEEEKQRADEEAERKRQAQQIFKFCVKQKKPERQVIQPPSDHWLFSPFEIKENMTVSPIHRRKSLTSEEKEALMKIKVDKSDYLRHLPKRPVTKIKSMKAKLFQFCDNYRPPYFGTWRKRSKFITGRRPLGKEETLDYEVDSDAEWGEEDLEEGDECKSDEEDLDEDEDGEDDDGFLVEHGYLSSDEGESIYNEGLPCETDEERKKRMKERADEWENDQKIKKRRNQIKELIPNQYGPCFIPPGDDVSPIIKEHLVPGIFLCYID